jgi:[protein-PII] uridylyltransferase
METFHLCQRHNASLSEKVKDLMRESLNLINNDFRSSKEIRKIFLYILNAKAKIYETLKKMHESGILGRYIPEFGSLRVLVLYDLYHKYTVDERTLLAIKNLEDLRNRRHKKLERLSDILNSLKRPWILFLALLLHDAGKAVGKRHIRAIGERIGSALKRLDLTVEERERVLFLVKNHLIMSMISERRELSDPKVIEYFVSTVGDEENLKMLYLLSYADISAVRPGFWTDGKATLLEELYLRTLYALRGEPFVEDEAEKIYQIEEALKFIPDINKNGSSPNY